MKQKPEDKLFAQPIDKLVDFQFDEQVAHVFPDMINRSVPGYSTVIAMTGIIAGTYAQAFSNCYDLGCSLGASTLSMRHRISVEGARIIAVDNSAAMLDRCRQNIEADAAMVSVDLACTDLVNQQLENASVVVLNYTLQFVSLEKRLSLLQSIFEALKPGGVLLLSEKICFDDQSQQKEMEQLHIAFKKANGYSDLEISQKRATLENVLIPETLKAHRERLEAAGFSSVQVWFQCLNFASLLVLK